MKKDVRSAVSLLVSLVRVACGLVPRECLLELGTGMKE